MARSSLDHEEAAGMPPDPWAVETTRTIELSRPCKSIAYRGMGAAWLLMTFAAALGADWSVGCSSKEVPLRGGNDEPGRKTLILITRQMAPRGCRNNDATLVGLRPRATSSARSTFDRPPPQIRNHHAGGLEAIRFPLEIGGVPSKSATNQLGQYGDLEAVREEGCPGAWSLPRAKSGDA